MIKVVRKTMVLLPLLISAFISFYHCGNIRGAEQVAAGAYRIMSAYSGKYLDVGDGAICVQSDRKDIASQEWFIRKNSDNTWMIYSLRNGEVPEALVPGSEDHAVILLEQATGEESQKWTIQTHGDGTVSLISSRNQKVLDVPAFSLENRKALIQYAANEGGNQRWYLEKIDSNPTVQKLLESWKAEETANWNDQKDFIKKAAALIVIGIALFLMVDLLLFMKLVKPNLKIRGRLYYKKSDDLEGFNNSFNLGELGKTRITISFRIDDEADFHLERKGQPFKIILEQISDRRHFKLLEGYKALNKNRMHSTLKVRTTEPGIMIIGDIIYSNRTLTNGTLFEAGEMLFQYELEGN